MTTIFFNVFENCLLGFFVVLGMVACHNESSNIIACNEQGLALAAINLGKLTAQAYNISLAVKGRASTQAACAKPDVACSFTLVISDLQCPLLTDFQV